jgi:GH25 family lysozyme M1 (1,4-beta-N-acetylmuramidase)
VGLRQAKLAAALCAALTIVALAAPAAQAGPGRLGIDVSRFQGTIDWTSVKADGVRFAFVAASRGNGGDGCPVAPTSCGTDPYYDANYANARAAGIRVGPYHRAFVNGANQAELLADARAEAVVFVASVGTLRRKDLAPALDDAAPSTSPRRRSGRR